MELLGRAPLVNYTKLFILYGELAMLKPELFNKAAFLRKVLSFIRSHGGEAGANFLQQLYVEPKADTETVQRHLYAHPKILKRALLDMRVAAADMPKPVICSQYSAHVAATTGYGVESTVATASASLATKAVTQASDHKLIALSSISIMA